METRPASPSPFKWKYLPLICFFFFNVDGGKDPSQGTGDVNFGELTLRRKGRWKSAKNNNKLLFTSMNFQKSTVIPETEGVYIRPYPSVGPW